MKWLIDEQSVAINEILVLIQKSIHLCEHAIDRLSDEDSRQFFLQEFREYNAFLSGLKDFIRIKGELPREPDSEQEALEQWKVDIVSMFSPKEESGFLEHYRELQEELLASIRSAQEKRDMPESIGSLLKELDRHADRTLSSLKEQV